MTEVRLHELDTANLHPRFPYSVETDDPILARRPRLGAEVVRPIGNLNGEDASVGIVLVALDLSNLEQIEAGKELGPLPGLVVLEALPARLEEAPLPLSVAAQLVQVAVD